MVAKYPIGFWNYQPTGKYGPEEVRRWIDCGMTLTMSPEFNPEEHDKKDLLAIMDECAKQGMKLIICDSRARWTGAAKDPEGYRARFLQAYEDFGKHPAAYGFHIGDEPWGDMIDDCVVACKAQLEIAPELTPFLNFLPYWPGMESTHLNGKQFGEWTRDFAKESGCRMMCYDCYSQMNPEEEGTDRYFLNLRKFSEAAKAADVPLWNTVLSVGHFRYRVPGEDDLRWQVNTSVACGCKGLLWFTFYTPNYRNYRNAPIDTFDEKTQTYTSLSRVLRSFHRDYGELFSGLTLKNTYMIKKSYGGYPVFPENSDPTVRRVESKHNLPGIVSLFEDGEGRQYWVIVNNSPYESGMFTFGLAPGIKTYNLDDNGKIKTDFARQHHDAFYRASDVEIQAGVWLAPGQMTVFQFEH